MMTKEEKLYEQIMLNSFSKLPKTILPEIAAKLTSAPWTCGASRLLDWLIKAKEEIGSDK
jgi:hypothetical protein